MDKAIGGLGRSQYQVVVLRAVVLAPKAAECLEE